MLCEYALCLSVQDDGEGIPADYHQRIFDCYFQINPGETCPVRGHGLGVLRDHGAEPEYFEAVDPRTLAPVDAVDREVLLVCAARVGGVRLIDNEPVPTPTPTPTAEALTPAGAATAAN